jgi:hypothetical protein
MIGKKGTTEGIAGQGGEEGGGRESAQEYSVTVQRADLRNRPRSSDCGEHLGREEAAYPIASLTASTANAVRPAIPACLASKHLVPVWCGLNPRTVPLCLPLGVGRVRLDCPGSQDLALSGCAALGCIPPSAHARPATGMADRQLKLPHSRMPRRITREAHSAAGKLGRGCWPKSRNPLPTARDTAGTRTSFRITHPFHPWFDQEFRAIECRHGWRENRVYFLDGYGHGASLPLSWTNLAAPDPFLIVSAGKARFRPRDLLELVAMIQRMRNAGPTSNDSGEGG